jgi:hypothetical protein
MSDSLDLIDRISHSVQEETYIKGSFYRICS